ncbi:MAG: AI-2E family transporter [Spirochaetota bacterium]
MEHPRIRVIEVFFLLMLIGLSWGFFLVMRPFILNTFIAAIFTSVLSPAHERLKRSMRGRGGLAALLMVLLVFIVVAVPVSIIGVLVYSEAVSGYSAVVQQVPQLTSRLADIRLLEWARDVPMLSDYLDELEPLQLSEMVRNAVRTVSDFVLSATQRSFVSASTALANFVLVLLLMFFFFQSGRQFLAAIYNVVPMPNRELREIAEETRRTTTATIISTLLIGVLEGLYGAALFLVFGLPSPFLWGIVIMVLSMIPLVGTNLVLVPAGIVLMVTGNVLGGIAVVLLGFGGVAVTQNVIKPKLLGDRTGLNPALALLSTLGGIAWLGLIGFLVGPLIASLFIVIWQQFAIRYHHELSERDPEGQARAEGSDTGSAAGTERGHVPKPESGTATASSPESG